MGRISTITVVSARFALDLAPGDRHRLTLEQLSWDHYLQGFQITPISQNISNGCSAHLHH